MVGSVKRATSNLLCLSASMARSNRTLSGCFESTLAIGLLTFLLVQATQSAKMPSRIKTGIRRNIREPREIIYLRSTYQETDVAYTLCSVASLATFNNFCALLLGSP